MHDKGRNNIAGAEFVHKLLDLFGKIMQGAQKPMCEEGFINIKVGKSSPVFGGALVDWDEVFVTKFKVSGYDQSVSRLEVFGCTSLLHAGYTADSPVIQDTKSPCGEGPQTLLWAWYNGQRSVSLPNNTAAHVGYSTNIHFMVVRLVKFHQNKLTSHSKAPKIVKVSFTFCEDPKKFKLSNYRFLRTAPVSSTSIKRERKLDIACTLGSRSGLIIDSYIGDMGVLGMKITFWIESKKEVDPEAAGASGEEEKEDNEDEVEEEDRDTLVGSLTVSNKIHKLDIPTRARPGDTLKVRCEYHDSSYFTTVPTLPPPSPHQYMDICKLTLITMVSNDSPFSPITCSSPADFGPEDASLGDTGYDLVLFVQNHSIALAVFVLVMILLAVLIVRCGWRTEREGSLKTKKDHSEYMKLLKECDDMKMN